VVPGLSRQVEAAGHGRDTNLDSLVFALKCRRWNGHFGLRLLAAVNLNATIFYFTPPPFFYLTLHGAHVLWRMDAPMGLKELS
jgi:hypothetical protein